MISKIIGNIYETHDYDSFKKLLGNRDVKNVDNIKKSISDVGQLVVPIIVNEKMEIIDGQNRFDAWEINNLPIYYIICKGYGIRECIAMNTTSSKWNIEDYIKCYAKYGYYDYILLESLESEYSGKLSHQIIRAVAYGYMNSSPNSAIKNGSFKVSKNEQEIRDALEFLAMFEIPKSIKGNAKLLYYVIRFCYEFDGVDNAKLLRQWDECKAQILGVTDIKSAAEAIEKIYNYRTKKAFVFIATEYRKAAELNCPAIPGGGKSRW